jgi:hypothetical protein
MWDGAGNGAEAIDCALRFTRQSDYQERPTMAANERDKMAFGVSFSEPARITSPKAPNPHPFRLRIFRSIYDHQQTLYIGPCKQISLN